MAQKYLEKVQGRAKEPYNEDKDGTPGVAENRYLASMESGRTQGKNGSEKQILPINPDTSASNTHRGLKPIIELEKKKLSEIFRSLKTDNDVEEEKSAVMAPIRLLPKTLKPRLDLESKTGFDNNIKKIDPSPPYKGSRVTKPIRAHLASLTSKMGAKREWEALSQKYVGLLSGVTGHIKEVNLPRKGRYFRVFAGNFSSLTGASAFCDVMKERKQYCVPMLVNE